MTASSGPNEEAFAQSAAHSYSENIKHSRTNLVVLLLAQIYCLITIASTQDAALLSNSANLQLPILETSISIETFYILAPLILLVLFFQFQIHLRSFLISAVARARAERRDPVALVDTYPWFVTSSIARRFARDRGVRDELGGFSAFFEYFAGLLFAWFSTAIVIVMMWGRYLTKHSWPITTYHSALVGIAVAAAVYFLFSSRSSLRGQRLSGVGAAGRSLTLLVFFALPFSALMYASWWLFEAQDRAGCEPSPFPSAECSSIFLITDRLEQAGLSPYASLDGVDVSERPDGWTTSDPARLEDLAAVRGADLRQEDLRYASARDALFVRADLEEASLRFANFEGALFQGARLEGADMSFSNFATARFDHADLTNATLDVADLTEARFYRAALIGTRGEDILAFQADFSSATGQDCVFERSDFREARFDDAGLVACRFSDDTFDEATFIGARLTGARFEAPSMNLVDFSGAELVEAQFEGARAFRAKFVGADLFGASIVSAQMDQANFEDAIMGDVVVAGRSMRDSVFRRADLRGARFEQIDLSGSDFAEALFYGAVFAEADLSFATFAGADLSGADLSGAIGLEQAQLNLACGDAATQLPERLRVRDCSATAE